MAAPIGLLFVWLGSLAGMFIIRKRYINSIPTIILLSMFSVPALMSFEYVTETENYKVKAIVTTIEINASPETVGKM